MKHFASASFWTCYRALPRNVRVAADHAYDRLKGNPRHPSLHFKKVGRFWSVRIGSHHRALAVEAHDGLVWFWIGTHADYDTERGERALARWLIHAPADRPSWQHDEFSLKLLVLTDRRSETMLSLLRDQRARHLRRLARLAKHRARISEDSFIHRMLLQRADMSLRSELAWLQVLEDAIAARQYPAPRVAGA